MNAFCDSAAIDALTASDRRSQESTCLVDMANLSQILGRRRDRHATTARATCQVWRRSAADAIWRLRGTVCGLKGANLAAVNDKSPLDDNTRSACGRLLATQCNTAPVASSKRTPREWSARHSPDCAGCMTLIALRVGAQCETRPTTWADTVQLRVRDDSGCSRRRFRRWKHAPACEGVHSIRQYAARCEHTSTLKLHLVSSSTCRSLRMPTGQQPPPEDLVQIFVAQTRSLLGPCFLGLLHLAATVATDGNSPARSQSTHRCFEGWATSRREWPGLQRRLCRKLGTAHRASSARCVREACFCTRQAANTGRWTARAYGSLHA